MAESHIRTRIDKGVKRGPRLSKNGKLIGRPPHTQELSPRRKNGQIAEKLSNDHQAIEQAMREYAAGATLESLAKTHHVTRQAIYSWLLGDLGGEQHNSLVTQALTARIAKADNTLETSTLPLDVQRGREMARFSRMDYERRRPHLYGQKQEVTMNIVPVLSITVAPMPGIAAPQHDPQVIDSTCDTVQQISDKKE